MGNKSLARSKTKKIDGELQMARERDRRVIKILLLGAGESGKSTIFKQMRIISGEGFSVEARKDFRPKLIRNLIEGCLDILYGMEQFGIGLEDPKAEKMAQIVRNNEDVFTLLPEVAEAINYLWNKNEKFKETFELRAQYQLQDTWDLLADELKDYPEWGGEDWIPSVEDVIRARVRTSGIVDEEFHIKKAVFRMFDVGGQRSERRKWIHCFENVTAIFFIVAIQAYDQVLFEDSTRNRLIEAIELFKSTVMSTYFKKTPVILFLNKSDLFREKLCEKKVPLNTSGLFPDAPDTFDYDEGKEYIKKLFLKGLPKSKDVYIFDTCATNTDNIDKVFAAATDIILRSNLRVSGLV